MGCSKPISFERVKMSEAGSRLFGRAFRIHPPWDRGTDRRDHWAEGEVQLPGPQWRPRSTPRRALKLGCPLEAFRIGTESPSLHHSHQSLVTGYRWPRRGGWAGQLSSVEASTKWAGHRVSPERGSGRHSLFPLCGDLDPVGDLSVESTHLTITLHCPFYFHQDGFPI